MSAQMARWPAELGRPVDPMDAVVQMRAQSILTKAGAIGPLLPIEQARDVVREYESQLARREPVTMGSRLRTLFHVKHGA